MSTAGHPDRGRLWLRVHDGDSAEDQLPIVAALYAEIYAEAPYHETSDDVQQFVSDWPRVCAQPDFRLVTAHIGTDTIGFAFGYGLTAATHWWDNTFDPLPEETTSEHEQRTFAIIEIAVQHPHRHKGIGQALHNQLTNGLPHERLTLCVRPDAPAPQHAYHTWGYHQITQVQPSTGGPIYDLMIKHVVHSPTVTGHA